MEKFVVFLHIIKMNKLGAMRNIHKSITVEATNKDEAIEKAIDSLKGEYHPTRIVGRMAERKRFFNPLVFAC